ncbi:hypothetical protein QFC22_001111 [Naganishia vaughanmartiniae]|uniref:Uncharacterized protein n=1 Tax=Naganishia vaughanmartiniae TaxID=1424756 RepID=A0ACC2XKY9_9TREE|nr:hypothetical protein QFC22_001111 [Naganishia vaughanmartiniae]
MAPARNTRSAARLAPVPLVTDRAKTRSQAASTEKRNKSPADVPQRVQAILQPIIKKRNARRKKPARERAVSISSKLSSAPPSPFLPARLPSPPAAPAPQPTLLDTLRGVPLLTEEEMQAFVIRPEFHRSYPPPPPPPARLDILQGADRLTREELRAVIVRPEFRLMNPLPPPPALLDLLQGALELTEEEMLNVTSRPEFQRTYPPPSPPKILDVLRRGNELTAEEMQAVIDQPEFQRMFAPPPPPTLLDILQNVPVLTEEEMRTFIARPEYQKMNPPPPPPTLADVLEQGQEFTDDEMRAVIKRPEFQRVKQQVITTLDITLANVLDRKSTMNDADIEMLGSRHEWKMPNKLDKFLAKVGKRPLPKAQSSTSAKLTSEGKVQNHARSIKPHVKQGHAAKASPAKSVKGAGSSAQATARTFTGVAMVAPRQKTRTLGDSSIASVSGSATYHSSASSLASDTTDSHGTQNSVDVRPISTLFTLPDVPVRSIRGETANLTTCFPSRSCDCNGNR